MLLNFKQNTFTFYIPLFCVSLFLTVYLSVLFFIFEKVRCQYSLNRQSRYCKRQRCSISVDIKLIPQWFIVEYYNNCENTCSMYLPIQSSFRGYRININKCQTVLCYCLHKMVCFLSICILISYMGFSTCSADSCEYFSIPNAFRPKFLTYL